MNQVTREDVKRWVEQAIQEDMNRKAREREAAHVAWRAVCVAAGAR